MLNCNQTIMQKHNTHILSDKSHKSKRFFTFCQLYREIYIKNFGLFGNLLKDVGPKLALAARDFMRNAEI